MALETTQLMLDANTITAITSNINSLYTNLVSYTVGLILLVGALIPLAISFFQNKQFKAEQNNIKLQITNEIEALRIKIEDDLKSTTKLTMQDELNKFRAQMAEIRTELLREICCAKASSFHNQANMNTEIPELVISSCEAALSNYLEGSDERNARSILGIIEVTLTKLNKKSFETSPELQEDVDSIIKCLEENNENGRYSINLYAIKSSLKTAQKNETSTTTIN